MSLCWDCPWKHCTVWQAKLTNLITYLFSALTKCHQPFSKCLLTVCYVVFGLIKAGQLFYHSTRCIWHETAKLSFTPEPFWAARNRLYRLFTVTRVDIDTWKYIYFGLWTWGREILFSKSLFRHATREMVSPTRWDGVSLSFKQLHKKFKRKS